MLSRQVRSLVPNFICVQCFYLKLETGVEGCCAASLHPLDEAEAETTAAPALFSLVQPCVGFPPTLTMTTTTTTTPAPTPSVVDVGPDKQSLMVILFFKTTMHPSHYPPLTTSVSSSSYRELGPGRFNRLRGLSSLETC